MLGNIDLQWALHGYLKGSVDNCIKIKTTAPGCKKKKKKLGYLILIASIGLEIMHTVVCHQNHTEDSKAKRQFLQKHRTKAGAIWKQGEAMRQRKGL